MAKILKRKYNLDQIVWGFVLCSNNSYVVYFDQQTGALHTIRWSKSFVLNKFFHIFPSLTEKKERKALQKSAKTCNQKGVYQRLGVTLKRWLTPGENVIFT